MDRTITQVINPTESICMQKKCTGEEIIFILRE